MRPLKSLAILLFLTGCYQSGGISLPSPTETYIPTPTLYPPPDGFLQSYIAENGMTPEELIEQVASAYQTVTFGEWHVVDNEALLIDYLPIFAEHGFRYFCPEVDIHYQEAFDQFNNYEIDIKELKRQLRLDYDGLLLTMRTDENTLQLYLKAREVGLQIVAIDNQEIEYQRFTHDRDLEMFLNIQELTSSNNPDVKVIFFGGMAHAVEDDYCGTIPLGKRLEEYFPAPDSNASILFVGPSEIPNGDASMQIPLAFFIDPTLAGFDYLPNEYCYEEYLTFGTGTAMIVYQDH